MSIRSRPHEPPLTRSAFRIRLVAIALLAASSAAAQTLDPGAALTEAKAAFARGDYDDALGVVRSMRIQTPNSRHLPEALLLAAQAALVSEPFRARFFVETARSHPQTTDAIHFEISVTAAELARRDRLLTEALAELQRALRLSPAEIPRPRLDQVRIQAAELALYELDDLAAAAYLTLQIVQPQALEPADRRTYDRLIQEVLWSTITPEMLGLPDANISVITVDADDVWIGTYNGGAARYSQGTGIASRFTSGTTGGALSDTIRAITVDGNWVWMGTYEGLSVYSKATSRLWRIEHFGTPGSGGAPIAVVSLEGIDGRIAAGTLGQGLWMADDPDGEWERVADNDLLGPFVLALLRSGSTLYIGTQDRGVAVMDLETERLRRVAPLWSSGVRNVRSLARDESGKIWVGTYGNGLYRWDPGNNEVTRFAKSTGTLADDFVLAATATPETILVGTFGGGAYRYSLGDGRWTEFNLDTGLKSMEISSLAHSGPFTYFGTLGDGVAVLADSLQYAADAASK
jgi:tetratricopeptide (TPR) repeat protein